MAITGSISVVSNIEATVSELARFGQEIPCYECHLHFLFRGLAP